MSLARCDEAAGDADLAGRRFAQVLDIGQTVGEPGLVATALEGLARLAAGRGEREAMEQLVAEAGAVRSTANRPAPPYERRDLEAVLALSEHSGAVRPG